MEKNKRMITIAIAALIVAIISVAIAFAALSQTLTIDGGATFNPATWDVRFDTASLQRQEIGDATGTMPAITATTIGTYAVTLTKPGDAVIYTFDVVNTGSLNAVISALTRPAPTCVGTGASAAADAAMVCDNLVYTLTNATLTGPNVALGDVLAMNTGRQTMVLRVEYPMTMTTVPANDVTITIPQVVITYSQQ